ncbi:MAG: ABC transporter permease [Candidatus Magnetoovum sp. WYHC-5]|nr:ABC transporter permease [Candidatus Magnetoovum sp. WYHC-5]
MIAFIRNIILNIKISIESFSNFKLRTALAVFGVVLGTLSLITVANVSDALSFKTEQEIAKLGKNLLIVKSDIRHFGPRVFSDSANLTIWDAIAIKDFVQGVQVTLPVANKTFPVRYKDVVLKSSLVMGVNQHFFNVRGLHLSEGSFFTKKEIDNSLKTVVIGSKVADTLFGTENPIGKYIYLYRAPFIVIGTLESIGVDLANVDQDNIIYVPLTTYLRRLVNDIKINLIYIQVVDNKAMPSVQQSIEKLLQIRHKIKKGLENDFSVVDLKDVTSLQTQAMTIVKTLGLITSCLSFVISSIGILSIMVLIVNERKVEIGIRRAVGSRKRDIVWQFLTESSFISLLGAIAGLIVGILLTAIISKLASIPFIISMQGIIVAFFASLITGILSGIYPSKKAIEIQPVQVLKK